MERIDIIMQMLRIKCQNLWEMLKGGSSAVIHQRIEIALERQRKRFEGTDIASNADMRPRQIRKYCALDDSFQAPMKTAMRQLA